MDDLWKGEHLIRSRPKTETEKRRAAQEAVQPFVHRRLTEAGDNYSRRNTPWASARRNQAQGKWKGKKQGDEK